MAVTTAGANAFGGREHDVKKVVFASLVGSTIEWYDFFLYGVVAGIVFNKLYFPADDPTISVLLAYATFAVGFVARPLGGLVFGHFGDRIGRKTMLVLTLLLMGGATVLIGLLPTYDQIGILAPILLLVLRVAQGIGIGGEWGGAVLMAYEFAPEHKRGFYASIPQIGLSLGLFMASGVMALLTMLPDEAFMAWGWRTAFIASIVLVVLGTWIRSNIGESPEFKKAKAESRAKDQGLPFVDMIKRYPGNVTLGMGARYIDGVFFNVFAVFSILYLTQYVGLERSFALWTVSGAAIVMVFCIPFFGRLSDRIGRPRTYAMGSALLALSVFPAFALMSSGDPLLVVLGIVLPFGVVYPMCYGPEAALFSDLFDPSVRYTGVSFVYQFSGIFASGITPMIATWLMAANDNDPFWLCTYVVFAGLVSMVCAMLIGRRERR
ncbi:MFS transporter [Paracoccus denitrificans]|jgi:metabolite-proton symporter|uniref:Major facilitator superfamily MFS_1 n=1 Tax=Paracoccus denitrificans (strain Pd 1222) TaxID=318586 RepID=A1B9Z9_PARDP|nr:MFS transporter [Paracoccus denitrificans]ABL72343.1 major facilitator superfamily MFS_1 [Paracoccus denitrificans PD1222]MBB4628474.1 metabolite-proton symporter [Paracoccus denitrificans]MCU7430224.1 MHS family MFS transporter [Paracoccus denitrificans]QAR28907.1 MFS transporter [Paracoccus denitrificans]UFS66748.1 MHS family MFS transporter [Paracoccus denitrificans]